MHSGLMTNFRPILNYVAIPDYVLLGSELIAQYKVSEKSSIAAHAPICSLHELKNHVQIKLKILIESIT